jgi:hypothetical protein
MYAPGFIGLAKERAVGADGITTDLHNRNTLASRTVCMRACRTYLVIKAGKSFILSFWSKKIFFLHFSLFRNIVTYRAEDGSGVGSAIIAGACGVSLGLSAHPSSLLTQSILAMTKIRKDQGSYLNV